MQDGLHAGPVPPASVDRRRHSFITMPTASGVFILKPDPVRNSM
jgi:hypothetical protein